MTIQEICKKQKAYLNREAEKNLKLEAEYRAKYKTDGGYHETAMRYLERHYQIQILEKHFRRAGLI